MPLPKARDSVCQIQTSTEGQPAPQPPHLHPQKCLLRCSHRGTLRPFRVMQPAAPLPPTHLAKRPPSSQPVHTGRRALLNPLATSAAGAPSWLWPKCLLPAAGCTVQCQAGTARCRMPFPPLQDTATEGVKWKESGQFWLVRTVLCPGTWDPEARGSEPATLGAPRAPAQT